MRYTSASELVGKEIKGFKVLDWKTEKGRAYLLVVCPLCKKQKWMRRDLINDPKTRSCGCYNISKNQFKNEDITGKTFGRLTAIRPTDKKVSNGATIWECRCSCGNITYSSIGLLKKGGVRSCGCLSTENSIKNGKNAGKTIKEEYCIAGTNINNLTAKIRKNNTSGIKGVCWDKRRNKWLAQIRFQGHNYHLGRYTKIEDAAEARKEAEKNIFGDFLDWYYTKYPDKRKEKKNEQN